MAERHNLVHGIKDDWVLDHPIIVELADVLDFRNSPLIELEVVLLQAEGNRFHNIIDDPYHKRGMVSV